MPHLTKSDRRAKVSANEANRRRLVALAELRQLQLRKLKGELLDREDVSRTWEAHIESVKARLLILPAKLAPKVAALSTELECQVLIDAEIRSVLTELSGGESKPKSKSTGRAIRGRK